MVHKVSSIRQTIGLVNALGFDQDVKIYGLVFDISFYHS